MPSLPLLVVLETVLVPRSYCETCQLIDEHWSVLLQYRKSTGVNGASHRCMSIARLVHFLDSFSLFTTTAHQRHGTVIAYALEMEGIENIKREDHQCG